MSTYLRDRDSERAGVAGGRILRVAAGDGGQPTPATEMHVPVRSPR